MDFHYDIVVVGAGVAGSALAHALSTSSASKRNPLKIVLLERSLAKPDRIVGELLQPGGILALKELGLESCVEQIEAIPAFGYCVLENGNSVRVPYPEGYEGRSFHHGNFIMALRDAAKRSKGVDVIEAVVTDLIEDTGRVVGVQARKKDSDTSCAFYAKLVIVADGSSSKIRKQIMGTGAAELTIISHFVGLILEDATLPIPKHGTVAFVKGYGPVLLYQISPHNTRMLVDVKEPLPSDIKYHILTNIMPQLPSTLHEPIKVALERDRIRRMPNPFLPAIKQGFPLTKPGAILVGDSWNIRHPLTGGGMTVALNDVVLLRDMLAAVDDLSQWQEVNAVLSRWHWKRKPLSSTINILSLVLYEMFGAADEELSIMRSGCFKYFELGGEYVRGTVSLLAGISKSPFQLFRHFFAVALYAIWLLFVNSPYSSQSTGTTYFISWSEHYLALLVKSILVIWKTCVVFFPLLWEEVRWWPPTTTTSILSSTVSNSTNRLNTILITSLSLLCAAYCHLAS